MLIGYSTDGGRRLSLDSKSSSSLADETSTEISGTQDNARVRNSNLSSQEFNSATLAAAFARFQLNWLGQDRPANRQGSEDEAGNHLDHSEVTMPDDDEDVVVDDQSPVAKLKELLEKQKELEDKDKALKADLDANKAQIDVLKPAVTELENAETAFNGAAATSGQELAGFQKYFDTKEGMVGGALGEKKEKVIAAVKEVDDAIKEAKEDVTGATKNASEAEAAYEAAKKDVDDKKKAYQDVKDKPKALGGAVTKLKGLQTEAEKLDPQKLASMYAYLLEINAVLKGNPVPTPGDYLKELNKAREELDKANEEAAAKKKALDAAKEKLAQEAKELENLEKDRTKNILEKVEALNA